MLLKIIMMIIMATDVVEDDYDDKHGTDNDINEIVKSSPVSLILLYVTAWPVSECHNH